MLLNCLFDILHTFVGPIGLGVLVSIRSWIQTHCDAFASGRMVPVRIDRSKSYQF